MSFEYWCRPCGRMVAVDANNPHAVAAAERREWRRLTKIEIADAVIAEHRQKLKGLTPEFEARIRARFVA